MKIFYQNFALEEFNTITEGVKNSTIIIPCKKILQSFTGSFICTWYNKNRGMTMVQNIITDTS